MCSRNVQAKRPVPYNLCQVMTVYVSYVQSASCKPKWSLAVSCVMQEENPYILHNYVFFIASLSPASAGSSSYTETKLDAQRFTNHYISPCVICDIK